MLEKQMFLNTILFLHFKILFLKIMRANIEK